MKKTCIIVDDEPIAQQILEQYIQKVDALDLVGISSNAIDALDVLHKEKIDVMFLDIKMPSMTGLELLKTLQHPPKVILTTAFAEFGVESYEYGVVDYLLKPISFDRFLKAVNRLLIPLAKPVEEWEEQTNASEVIFFKADKKIHKFYLKDILFIEGSGNYIKVFSAAEKPLMVLDKLSSIIEKLPPKDFCRVHKSFIVNTRNIKQIEGNRVKLGDHQVPISATYKQSFEQQVMNNKQTWYGSLILMRFH